MTTLFERLKRERAEAKVDSAWKNRLVVAMELDELASTVETSRGVFTCMTDNHNGVWVRFQSINGGTEQDALRELFGVPDALEDR